MAYIERYFSTTGAGAHDGTSEANAWTFAEMVSALPGLTSTSQYRINGIAGTYTQTATLTLNPAAHVVIRFYNTTPGDIDNDPSAAGGQISFNSGFALRLSQTKGLVIANSTITGDTTGGPLIARSGYPVGAQFDNCTITQNGSHEVINTYQMTSTGISNCLLVSNSTTNDIIKCSGSAQLMIIDSILDGGKIGISQDGNVQMMGSIIRNTARESVKLGGGNCILRNNTFHTTGSSYSALFMDISGYYANVVITGNIFSNIGGYGILINTEVGNCVIKGNSFYSCTSGEFSSQHSTNQTSITETSAPTVSSSDLTLVSGALSRGSLLQANFRGKTYRSYGDRGAVQSLAGGSAVINKNTTIFIMNEEF